MSVDLSKALQLLVQRYIARTPRSRDVIASAATALPGGSTRSVLHFAPYPLVIQRAEASTLIDLDGHRYRDFLNDFSACLYGHQEPRLRAAILEAVDRGLTVGGVNAYEGEFARLLTARFPALERVRFTNSGTEANLMAVATARVATRRSHILVMNGGYHGSALQITPSAALTNAPFPHVSGTFNDLAQTLAATAEVQHDLAAILVEPMVGAGGCIPAEAGFLEGLRAFADRCGAVLIFDEVMTSRLGRAGAHGEYGVMPDLMTAGKYLGGGGNFGMFGGREDLMAVYDAGRPDALMHGGTFNNNSITMAAGLTGLRDIYTPERAVDFLALGNRFRDELNALAAKRGAQVQVSGIGSLMTIHLHAHAMKNPAQNALSSAEARAVFHLAMLERDIYLARRGYVSLSLANTEQDLEAFKLAFTDVLDEFFAAAAAAVH